MKFLQCEKYVWLYKERKDLLEEVSEVQQAIFDQGYEVEEYAQRLFPKGEFQMDVKAAFGGKANQLYARADIVLGDSKKKTYDIYEVKGATMIKPEYLYDLAFQKIAFEAGGYTVGKTCLVHVNNEYVRKGEVEPEKFLTVEDVTEEINELVPEVEGLIPHALAGILRREEPEVRIVKQCKRPYTCPFISYCWDQAKIPDYSVYNLTRIGEKTLLELLDRGVLALKDIPDDVELSVAQAAQVKVAQTGKPVIQKAKIKKALGALAYPLYFLDYETVNTGVPLWDGIKPYQQVCFQYSLHVVREAPKGKSSKAKLEHFEYLASGQDNPMPGLLAQLRKDIADDGGSVIVWYKSFEMGRNSEMAELYPEYREFLESVNERVYDLMDIFKKQYYVHPGFRGSCSIKKVLPALLPELSYENLEDIREGSMAGLRWLEVEFGEGLKGEERERVQERERVRGNLLKYCERDTLAMVGVMGEVG